MNIKRVENLHVALWLAKDTSWCSGWEVPAFLMVVPTVWVAVRIAWHSRNDAEDLVHNVAVCLWIMANLVWMTGEFFFDDGTRPLARVFFYAGMALLAVYYLGKGARTWRAAR